ncbi:uncharacterized protein LOC142324636 isoform X2 [Lycorma delicatula]|uniref:uncharacterized protein LOC142324636 isoform X2 n=1 Tax=Lycorma delicatula TaxID=130591 RepID=UPI003F513BCF
MFKPPNENEEHISLHSRIAAERYYTKAAEVYENLDCAFKNIELELKESSNVDEIVLMFGATPSHAQNIFRIQIPLFEVQHKEENHPTRKHLPCLFQALISSEELNKLFSKKLSPTNTFILLKVKEGSDIISDKFHQKDSYRIPVRISHIKFILKHEKLPKHCGCDSDNVAIFCDTPSRHFNVSNNVIYSKPCEINKMVVPSNSAENNACEKNDVDYCFFQFTNSIKGFKDCKIDGVSVVNLWLKHTTPL